ncbi:MAG TPA: DUF3500 domain-containing protein [Steroidobacteraceae bacterium]|jgi:hypothetical protein|nr:DUF3500 domain-containing protein [Steroidobacteraceae bacterium]
MQPTLRSVSCVAAVTLALAITHLTPGFAQSRNAEVVNAANSFLATLSAEQRQKVLYDYGDAGQRARWSNLPTGFVPRGGISLKQMSAPQREATWRLLTVVLSPMGLEKVNAIRAADDDFKANGSKRGPGGGGPPPGGPGGPGGSGGPGGRGGPPSFASGDMFGSDLYYISFLGKPSMSTPWMLQFGGHHLALNITMSGPHDVLTPTLTGAQPAVFTLNGKIVRPLGRESDQALALVQSLDQTQRRQAVLNYTVPDLVLGPGQDNEKIVPEGLKASAMNPQQQAMMLALMGEWSGILNEPAATLRTSQLKAELPDTWFAWSGATTGKAGDNITAYFRIQGPHVVIEYAPQHDEPTNHVHTMYRDPTNDYGAAIP